MRGRWGRWLSGCGVIALAVTVACGGGDDGGSEGSEGSGAPVPEASDAADRLDVLVTNDDGVGAEGIDVLVEALRRLDGIAVTVVAPAGEQSGTGGSSTDGPVAHEEATTASGYEAVAVDGFPADSVAVALDELALAPDLVIAGINAGQNTGPLVEISGTVGAARAAARAGVPALAVSQGLGDEPDYETAAALAIEWVEDNRDDLVSGTTRPDAVTSLNVPTCPTGQVQGTVEVVTAPTGDHAGDEPDCTPADDDRPATGTTFAHDIDAFVNGYAAFTEVPIEPQG